MAVSPQPTPQWRVIAAPTSHLCLDFANTRWWRGEVSPTETLGDFGAVLRWLAEAGVIDAPMARALRALPTADAAAAQRLHADMLQVRESLYGLFDALVRGSSPAAEVKRLNALLAAVPVRRELMLDGERAGWRVPVAGEVVGVGEILAPVLWATADLALAFERRRVRVCDNPKCLWLFLDQSKTGTRRWCSMGACGNRAKARRHMLRRSGRASEELPA